MLALRRQEAERLHTVVRQLQLIEDGAPRAFVRVLPEMKDLLGLEKMMSLELLLDESEVRLDAFHGVGIAPEPFSREYDALVRSSPRGWGHFSPARPEANQRNRALTFAPLGEAGPEGQPAPAGRAPLRRDTHSQLFQVMGKTGILQDWQLRVLVCEGDSLLAWVGGYRAEPPGRRECHMLQALTPALQRRLSVERLLNHGHLHQRGLAASLEEVSAPAFIVDAAGHVRYANHLGRDCLNREPSDTRKRLVAATKGTAGPEVRVTALGGAGLRAHFLIVSRSRPAKGAPLWQVSRCWSLTARQTQVLELLVDGQANKSIAAALDCAERTVEQHVTALLRKAGVDTRAALAAKVWKSA